jgi:hypothetical protein
VGDNIQGDESSPGKKSCRVRALQSRDLTLRGISGRSETDPNVECNSGIASHLGIERNPNNKWHRDREGMQDKQGY